jgi:hypothetical protein
MPEQASSANPGGQMCPGLTKLDYFAAMAMQGFLSHEGTRGMSQALAQKAYELAKHMIEEAKRQSQAATS